MLQAPVRKAIGKQPQPGDMWGDIGEIWVRYMGVIGEIRYRGRRKRNSPSLARVRARVRAS